MSEPEQTPSLERRLARAQAVSGLLFGSFLVVHLINTVVATAGQSTYDGFQRAARHYYQSAPVEIIAVIGAMSVHMLAGIARMWTRRRRHRAGSSPSSKVASKPSWRMRLHRWSAWYLLLVAAGHMLATRGVSFFLLGRPVEMSYLTFSLTTMPLYFYPYYAGLVAAGSYHLVNGVLLALPTLGVRLPKGATSPHARPFWIVTALLALIGVGALPALGGRYFTVDTSRFDEYRAIYKRYVPFLVK